VNLGCRALFRRPPARSLETSGGPAHVASSRLPGAAATWGGGYSTRRIGSFSKVATTTSASTPPTRVATRPRRRPPLPASPA